jgi:hypothetical protein
LGRQPERRFVEEEEARLREQGAGNGKLLLLAPRQPSGRGPVVAAEGGKALEDLLRPVAVGATDRGPQLEVLGHREPLEDAAALGHQRDAARDDALRRLADELLVAEADRSLAGAQHAHDGGQERRLPRPVRAHEPDGLARLDRERDVANRRDAAVANRQVSDLEHLPRLRRPGTR